MGERLLLLLLLFSRWFSFSINPEKCANPLYCKAFPLERYYTISQTNEWKSTNERTNQWMSECYHIFILHLFNASSRSHTSTAYNTFINSRTHLSLSQFLFRPLVLMCYCLNISWHIKLIRSHHFDQAEWVCRFTFYGFHRKTD